MVSTETILEVKCYYNLPDLFRVLRLVQALQGLKFEVPKANKGLSLLTGLEGLHPRLLKRLVEPDCLRKVRVRQGVAGEGIL